MQTTPQQCESQTTDRGPWRAPAPACGRDLEALRAAAQPTGDTVGKAARRFSRTPGKEERVDFSSLTSSLFLSPQC